MREWAEPRMRSSDPEFSVLSDRVYKAEENHYVITQQRFVSGPIRCVCDSVHPWSPSSSRIWPPRLTRPRSSLTLLWKSPATGIWKPPASVLSIYKYRSWTASLRCGHVVVLLDCEPASWRLPALPSSDEEIPLLQLLPCLGEFCEFTGCSGKKW